MCKANIKKYFFSMFNFIFLTWIAISVTSIYFLISSDSMSRGERGMLITLIIMYPFVVYALLFRGLFGFSDWANITLNQDLFGQSSDRLSRHLKIINELSSNDEFTLNLNELDWEVDKNNKNSNIYKSHSRTYILTEIIGDCKYNNKDYKIKIFYYNFKNFFGETIKGDDELRWRMMIDDKEFIANEPFMVEDIVMITKYKSACRKLISGYLRDYIKYFIEQKSLIETNI